MKPRTYDILIGLVVVAIVGVVAWPYLRAHQPEATPATLAPTAPEAAPSPSAFKNFGKPLGQPADNARAREAHAQSQASRAQFEADQRAVAERARNQPHDDWYPIGENEVKWFADDAFSHVGGHCYARRRDGSTQTSTGKPGLVQVGEKYCIAAGAKDTPFEVPDQR